MLKKVVITCALALSLASHAGAAAVTYVLQTPGVV